MVTPATFPNGGSGKGQAETEIIQTISIANQEQDTTSSPQHPSTPEIDFLRSKIQVLQANREMSMEKSTSSVPRNHPKRDVKFYRALRLEEPPLFDKKKHGLTGWLFSVKQHAQRARFTKNAAIFFACNKFGNKMPRVYRLMEENGQPISSFEYLKQIIEQRMGFMDEWEKDLCKLFNARQLPNRSANDYAIYLQDLHLKIQLSSLPDLYVPDEEFLIHRFRFGLKPELRRQIERRILHGRMFHPDSMKTEWDFQKWIQFAMQMEENC